MYKLNKLQRIIWTIPKMKEFTWQDKIKVAWMILIEKPSNPEFYKYWKKRNKEEKKALALSKTRI